MSLSKLESRIIVPSGGWSVSVQEFTPNAGPASVTAAASGNYFLSSATALTTTFSAALDANATLAGDYTCTINATTGKTTLSATGVTTFNLTWTSTDLRDALGFTGNLTGAASYESANSSPHVWIPNVPRGPAMAPDGSNGNPFSDTTITMATDGTTKAMTYATRYADEVQYLFVSGQKARVTHESVVNESWETFWLYMRAGGFVCRYHPDRTVDGTYLEYRWMNGNDLGIEPAIPTFTTGAASLWHVRSPVVKHS